MGTPYEQQDFATPTETREFPNGRLDLLHIGGADIGRLTLQPGWLVQRRQTGGGHRAVRGPALPIPRLRNTAHPDGRRRPVRRHPRPSHSPALRA
jgi:hypothetical protein